MKTKTTTGNGNIYIQMGGYDDKQMGEMDFNNDDRDDNVHGMRERPETIARRDAIARATKTRHHGKRVRIGRNGILL